VIFAPGYSTGGESRALTTLSGLVGMFNLRVGGGEGEGEGATSVGLGGGVGVGRVRFTILGGDVGGDSTLILLCENVFVNEDMRGIDLFEFIFSISFVT